MHTPARQPPRRRALSEPSKKRRKILEESSSFENVPLDVQLQPLPEEENLENKTIQRDVCPLDLLALTVETQELKSENQQLREQLAKVVLENENLRREQHKSLEKNSKFSGRETPLSATELNDSHVKNNFKYYTGFVYEQFRHIYSFLVSGDDELPFTYTKASSCWRTIKVEDQLLLTMIKLRLNFDHKHLSNLFLISQQDSSLIFTNWINFMFFKFGSVPIWPHRDVIMEKMPSKFKAEFKKCMVVLDGTEIKIQRPSSLTSQSQCYSDYKSATTLKGLIGVDPRGSVIFISTLFSGSTSDKEISTKSGLLDHLKTLLDCNMLETGDGVMVDKGFNIKDEIEGLGLEFIMPPYASSEGQMSAADVAVTKKIATHRVHVERAISRIKKFRILSDRLNLTLFSSMNQIWFVCCFLTNFMPYLIQD